MKAQRGFTLMEVLIAVGITAIIGIGVWQVLSSVVTARDSVDDLADQFEALQRTMLFLERDIGQIVNRPVRDVYGDFDFALTSRQTDFALVLTRQGWRNPLGIKRSELQRAGWEYTGSELRRRSWIVVDQGQEDTSRDVVMLDRVTDFSVRFLNRERAWQDNWPDDNSMANTTPGSRPEVALPLGIEVVIDHERYGELTRTFSLPDFDLSGAQNSINQSIEAQPENDEGEDEGETATETESEGAVSGG